MCSTNHNQILHKISLWLAEYVMNKVLFSFEFDRNSVSGMGTRLATAMIMIMWNVMLLESEILQFVRVVLRNYENMNIFLCFLKKQIQYIKSQLTGNIFLEGPLQTVHNI